MQKAVSNPLSIVSGEVKTVSVLVKDNNHQPGSV